MNIELITWIPVSLLILALITAWTQQKLSWYIVIFATIIGAGITAYINPYMEYSINPVRNWLFYGAQFDFTIATSLIHISGLFFASMVATFNSWISKGLTIWAMVIPQNFKGMALNEDREAALPLGWIWLIAGIPGLIAAGIYDIWASGGMFGADVTTSGIFGTQPFSFLGIAVAVGVILIIIAVIAFIFVALRSEK